MSRVLQDLDCKARRVVEHGARCHSRRWVYVEVLVGVDVRVRSRLFTWQWAGTVDKGQVRAR